MIIKILYVFKNVKYVIISMIINYSMDNVLQKFNMEYNKKDFEKYVIIKLWKCIKF